MTGFNYQFIGRMSSVTGIVDCGGGIRVVVTHPESLHYHVGPGERAFTVPDLWVQEPISWGSIPKVIEIVTKFVSDKLTSEKHHGC